MNVMTETSPSGAVGRRYNPVPGEGDNGVFTQTWFPICLSDELEQGKVIGRDFLGGRVAIFRDTDGTAHVVSAFCPHLGADISVGDVQGDNVRCPFHHWEFNGQGQCVRTAVGDPAPRSATLFKYPTMERFGLVFAFNGEEPLYDWPELFPYKDEELSIWTRRSMILDCDGWVFSANTPDMQHLKVLHGVTFLHEDPHARVEWNQWGFAYDFEGVTGDAKGSAKLAWRIGILGSNNFFQMGTHNGRWYGVLALYSCPKPQKSEVFLTILTHKGETAEDENAAAQFMAEMMAFEQQIVNEDSPVLNTIRYRPGTLTKADKSLARFLDYLRTYPRANPGAEYIY
ncbi:hypothetical protein MB02_12435 [Croceicoccus estronivorus]|uniref:Rieske 2Fe-2S domain-containing protein n=1 Tax=Croceicoccus estronivorus TaxID=1172626 RepID=UPI00082FB1B2|nr:Rieske 2Fe-2S domain-containing protein [Croceicoccus estronivorus]OCC23416.1 hypothetical protein MB02_12435 [Croceicoccus estronivorus]